MPKAPIDRLLDTVDWHCTHCGTRANPDVGCPCRAAPQPRQKERIAALAAEAAAHAIRHIDTMYPEMWAGVTKNARHSLRGCLINIADREP